MSAHGEATHAEHVPHGASTKLALFVWFWLLALTIVEVVLAYFQVFSPGMMLVILLSLSIIKAGLIMAYFMHLRYERLRLVMTLVPAAVIGLCLMIAFFNDSYRILEFGAK